MRIVLEEDEFVVRSFKGTIGSQEGVIYQLTTSATIYTFFRFEQLIEALKIKLAVDENKEADISPIFKGG